MHTHDSYLEICGYLTCSSG